MTYIWDMLSKNTLPKIIYGMGDGADKLLSLCARYDIKIDAIFASDEYVRDKFFHSFKVEKYSDICSRYDDFIVLLAFGAFEEKLMMKITDMAKLHMVLAPDMPLFGGDILTPNTLNERKYDINRAYSLLYDNTSRNTFEKILEYKLSGDINTLRSAESPRSDVFSHIIKFTDDESFLDLGAYNGDTVLEFSKYCKYKNVIAVEPDVKNYQKLCANTAQLSDIRCLNIGIWDKRGTLTFSGGGGRSSFISPDEIVSSSKQYSIDVDSIDNILHGERVTYIKMDVEGAEREALLGGADTIRCFAPALTVSAYHKTCDFFELILLIHSLNPNYKIYLRHHPYIPAWETNIYAI